jgi:DNA polymerase III gamma/tau subunit
MLARFSTREMEDSMKRRIITIAAVPLLFLGAAVVMWAQQDQQEQAKPVPQQTKPSKPESKPSEGKTESGREARTGPQQEEKRQSEDQNRARQEQQKQLENQPTHAQREQQKQTGEQQKHVEQEQQRQAPEQRRRAQDENNDRKDDRREARAQGARPGGPQRGARIPDDRFREHFGHEHRFRVERVVLVENRPRFQYTGYWFELVDPWPAAWSYSDDCYIDYVDDEYFLFNPLHPGIRIAVVVGGV